MGYDDDDPNDPRISPHYRQFLLRRREALRRAPEPRRPAPPTDLARLLDLWARLSEDDRAEFMARTGIWERTPPAAEGPENGP